MFKKILSAYKTSFSGLSKETWLLSLVILFNRCGFMAVPFMGLYVTQSLHRPESDAGIIISIFGVGSILGALVGGKLTDRIGFRPVQIVAAFVGGFFFIVFANTESFEWLCGLALIISFFSEAFRPANYAAIASYANPGTLTRSYSLNRLATNIGWAVGASMGGILAAINYKLLFYVDGGISMLVAVAIILVLPAKKLVKERKLTDVHTNVLKPWQDKVYVKFMLLSAMFVTCFFLMFRVVPVFYKEVWHINEAVIGLVLGLNGVIIAIFEMVLIRKIEDRRSPKFYIVLGVLFVSLSFCVLLMPKMLPLAIAIISVVLFTVGEMLSLPFFNTFVVSRSTDENRGTYAAGYTISWSVAQVIGPAFGFYVVEKLGYSSLWLVIILILSLCAYFFKRLKF